MRIVKVESLPSVKEGWVDRDVLLLHASFQIMEDFIEKEHPFDVDDSVSEKEYLKELKSLHEWWKVRKEQNESNNLNLQREDDDMLIRLIRIRRKLWI